MKEKIIEFVKKEVVLVVATVLAIISAFVVPPSIAYMEYIDWHVLELLFIKGKQEEIILYEMNHEESSKGESVDKRQTFGYLVLFALSLLVVAKMIPVEIVLGIVLIVVICLDKSVLKKVDYCLLLTFISFFIFTGNLGNIPAIHATLQALVEGRELLVGVIASQGISNVPAALLLSGFTTNYKELLAGVNVGGLGTLIASMASLISYKILANKYNEKKGAYLKRFTLVNLIFLVVLILFNLV